MAFTYLIGWRNLDRWYYGYSTRDIGALWNPYKTSSQTVHEFIQEHGDPDVIRVHKEFVTKKVANDYEIKFLKRVKAVKSDRWLNKNDTVNFRGPANFTDASRKKMSESAKKRIGGVSPWKGKKIPQEIIEKRAAGNRGRKRSPEAVANLKRAKQGYKPAKSTIEAVRISNRRRKMCSINTTTNLTDARHPAIGEA